MFMTTALIQNFHSQFLFLILNKATQKPAQKPAQWNK